MPRGHFIMLRLLIGIAYRISHTGFNLQLIGLLLAVFVVGYIIRVWCQVGKQ